MQHLGLTHTELRAYHAALASHHQLRIGVAICDLEENPIASLVPKVLGGQVTGDTTAPSGVTRMLDMQFLDPRNQLNLDPRSRTAGSLFMDRIVKVYYSVWVDALNRWVTCQPFTGLPWGKLEREGPIVTIQAHGMERLLLRPAWRPFVRKPPKRKVDVLEDFLRNRGGQAKFDFPKLDNKLGRKFVVGRTQLMWPRGKQLAHSMDQQLFFDGRAVCTLRDLPDHPCRIFRRGNGGTLLSEPRIDSDPQEFANTTHISGRKGLDAGEAHLKYPHPLSARNLTRNGVPGVIPVFDHNDHIRNEDELDKRAARRLDRQQQEIVTRTYTVLPHPHLDELDMVGFEAASGDIVTHQLTQWTLPLTGEAMTIGYTRRLTAARRDIRKR